MLLWTSATPPTTANTAGSDHSPMLSTVESGPRGVNHLGVQVSCPGVIGGSPHLLLLQNRHRVVANDGLQKERQVLWQISEDDEKILGKPRLSTLESTVPSKDIVTPTAIDFRLKFKIVVYFTTKEAGRNAPEITPHACIKL